MKKNIMIASPSTGWYNFETVAALIALRPPEGYQLIYNFLSNCLIYDAREKLVELAKKYECEYIFFIDSDMVPPQHTIQSMFNHNVDICSGMIFRRKYPFQPCFYSHCEITKTGETIFEGPMEPEKWPDKGIYEIQGCGMACCLIKMSVFDHIKKPYYFPLPQAGEDLAFCIKARKAGFKMYVDFGVDCMHVGQFPVMKESFKNAYQSWINDPSNEGKLMFGEE
jgi:hypothetical protein